MLLPFSVTAQDTTITISPAMLTPDYISLGNIDGWIFRQGNDIAWAKEDIIDRASWKKMKPSELSEKLTDKNGRLEGWLRIKIKLDTAFRDTVLGLHMNAWAASEVYVDGKMLKTFGNTGINGEPFKEYNPTYKLPVAFNVEKGNEHIIAVHLVDLRSTLPPYHLKSEERLAYFISITTPEFNTRYFELHLQDRFYRTMWLSVNIVLCMLFWLLTFQNRTEKNLLLIAVTSTIITLTCYADQYIVTPDLSYNAYRLTGMAWSILRSAGGVLGLVIMLRTFKQKISPLAKTLLIVILIGGPIELILNNSLVIIFQTFLITVVYAYYIIKCWKKLRGAQWAVLVGILLAMSFSVFAGHISAVHRGQIH